MAAEYFDTLNGFTVALSDDELFDFRPVRQDDWKILQDGMSALSSHSRYLRFFSYISRLSDAQLHYFTEVDQHDHVAWIALAHNQTEHPGVGIVRFIRMPNQPGIAEFAVTVIDNYQHRGLGTILMAVLYRLANIQDIQILRGFVLPENKVMVDWLGRLGAVNRYENGIYRMDIAVHSDLTISPAPQLLHYFRVHKDKIMPLTKHTPD